MVTFTGAAGAAGVVVCVAAAEPPPHPAMASVASAAVSVRASRFIVRPPKFGSIVPLILGAGRAAHVGATTVPAVTDLPILHVAKPHGLDEVMLPPGP
jgi:hypothetical protein